ncbi:hypothetical protein PQI07_30405 [Methylobacterium sp. 092160098-2]|uniref:hypothetical protein n=2 Tax=unclassified Methylobacterium TaxID=2615210 RepID=UPI002381A2B2|nr:hypothetical protein [Methylobacterium sp. 092160098-2]MDE4911703.1 hypothetical protein [Methylobacterium sp. 092160098-2]MDE4914954.1 hypothetical protein [Methylobacterium sp. 092160098-2]
MATLGATPRQNLEIFIESGRLAPAFGDSPFDDRIWIVPTRSNKPGGTGKGELAFTVRSTSEDPDGPAMAKDFGDFLKAVVRLDDVRKPSQINRYRRMVAVARMLYGASKDVGHDPCRLTGATFKRALRFAESIGAGTSSPYEAGTVLAKIAKILNDAGITMSPIQFTNTAKRPLDRHHVMVEGSDEDQEDSRMPDEGALDALARASQLVSSPPDILRMRIVELLPCAPWRINDILRLPYDCEVEEPVTRNGKPILDADGRPVVRYGIGYRGSKGFLADIKWIPTAMVDVARRAIRQIKELTAEARAIAAFMEENPGRAWLTDRWRLSSPDRILTGEEMREAVGIQGFQNIVVFVRSYRIPRTPCSTQKKWRYRLGDIEKALLDAIRPIGGDHVMKRSEYLMIATRNFFGSRRGLVPAIVDNVSYDVVKDFLQSRPGSMSVFERFDLKDANGEFFVLKTHQVRHFLNTIAAEGGLGEVDLARWSGREDVRSNQAYDHEPGYQLARKARKLLEQGKMKGPIAATWSRKPPVERKNFSLVQLATVHTTDIGLCLHDWGTAPCPHHGACADCLDCAVVKGDPVHRARIELLLADVDLALARSLEEVEDGTYGASNYVEHHRRMAVGYRRMLAAHDDPDIEDGTIVQMRPDVLRQGPLDGIGLAT